MFITAHGEPTVRPTLLAAGAAAFLSKPFSETALLDALDPRLELQPELAE